MLTLEFFWQYLFAKRSGSLTKTIARVCILATGLGIAVLILVMSVMAGFNEGIRKKLLATKPHFIFHSAPQDLAKDLALLQTNPYLETYQVDHQDVVVRTLEGLFGGALAQGIQTENLRTLLYRLKARNIGGITDIETLLQSANLGPDEIMIGAGLAKTLDVYEGDQVIVIPPESLLNPSGEIPLYQKVKVRAIIETELQDVDNELLFYNLEVGLKPLMGQRSRYTEIEGRLKNIADMELARLWLKENNLKFETWEDRDHALLFALKWEKILIAVFISLATLITSFSLVTVLTLLITQKRKDIGIIMAMGMSEPSIKRMFTVIGFILSSIGLLGGVLFGLLLCVILQHASLNFLPAKIYYDTSIPVVIERNLITYATLGGVFLALVASYLPVKFTMRFTPTDALRGR